ncbi:MAG TPA: aromatic-ring-hydroxylating dioxygenase subunit beta [Burkholderiaceae bacterium]|nr:aromatic-ring-hydroxylating dioxygenase subunit beta [Burkholderiaceae bacterium]
MSGTAGADASDLPFSEAEYRAIEQFIFHETRLADESRYGEWEALWDEDGAYWVPIGDGDYDRRARVSMIDDNRGRIRSRVKQLQTGKRYAQVPAAPMRRLVSNIELSRLSANEVAAEANFLLLELAMASTRQQRLWGGRLQYRLRRCDGGLKMYFKKVTLINAGEPVPNLPSLI